MEYKVKPKRAQTNNNGENETSANVTISYRGNVHR
jgi:hypothetical protein